MPFTTSFVEYFNEIIDIMREMKIPVMDTTGSPIVDRDHRGVDALRDIKERWSTPVLCSVQLILGTEVVHDDTSRQPAPSVGPHHAARRTST
jgi:hypothetical protein